ncbi:MAG: molybdate ABC transporter substrate-binding protein [Solimonas sp.]
MGEGHPASGHQGAVKAIRVLGGGAVQGLVEAVRPSFEASTGLGIDGAFGAVGAMKDRLLGGDPADLLILSRALIDELARDRHVVGPSAKDIGAVQTAIAVRRGDLAVELGSAGALRAALRNADEVHFPDPGRATAGIHFARIIKELGLQDEIAGRLKPAPNGAIAMRALAASTARRPIGCTQATEILAAPGVVLVAPLPPGCDLATTYTCALAARSTARPEATKLVAILTDERSREILGRLGFA